MKRTYSKEFKIKACELVIKDGIKHAIVAEKIGINKVMFYRWIDKYEAFGEWTIVNKVDRKKRKKSNIRESCFPLIGR